MTASFPVSSVVEVSQSSQDLGRWMWWQEPEQEEHSPFPSRAPMLCFCQADVLSRGTAVAWCGMALSDPKYRMAQQCNVIQNPNIMVFNRQLWEVGFAILNHQFFVFLSQTLPPKVFPIHEQVCRYVFGPLQSLHCPKCKTPPSPSIRYTQPFLNMVTGLETGIWTGYTECWAANSLDQPNTWPPQVTLHWRGAHSLPSTALPSHYILEQTYTELYS